jgi:steroid delta-isomerase-like uncharacterized protein
VHYRADNEMFRRLQRRSREMSAQENKALVERFVEEFWNEGNTSAADELMAPDAEIHMPTGEVVDVDGLKGFAGTFRESFPDWHSTFEELVAEGDRVAERWTGRGTHQGELQGIPPTGKRVEVPGSVFYRIVGGKIVEFRGQLDMMGLMQQLGVIAPPQQAEA